MRIAEEVVKQGMAAGTAFMDAITDLIWTNKLKKIIETGSYEGLGTTRAIRNGMTGGEEVYSIEVNPTHHRIAKRNNADSSISLLLGLSVPNSMKPVSSTFDVPDWVIVDHLPDVRNGLYNREIMFNVPDDMLRYAMSKFDFRPDLVILDSAGHMGLIEFRHLMSLVPDDHTFYLALDDTNHVKHYDTLQIIQADERFEEVFSTDEKFGSVIVKVSSR
jgi:hypothetical protein